MSGGSFDYLYMKSWDAERLREVDENTFLEMAKQIGAVPGGLEASGETLQIAILIKEQKDRITELNDILETAAEKLKDIWESVEMFVSCDRGLEDVQFQIEKFNADI